jgi:hypothetical protein
MALDVVFQEIVDGALWVKVDRRAVRMFVWKGSDSVGVYSIETGESLDDWPCEVSEVSAALTVAERSNSGY